MIIKVVFDYTFLTARQKRENRSRDGQDIATAILSEITLVGQQKGSEQYEHLCRESIV
jgi:hypothetical protein